MAWSMNRGAALCLVIVLNLLQPSACFSLSAMCSQPAHGKGFLDNTGGFWRLCKQVPLPSDRMKQVKTLADKLPPFPVTLDGKNMAEISLTEEDIHSCFLPLRQAVMERKAEAAKEGRRCIVGIAGPPGAGKTTFSEVFRAVWNADCEDGAPCAVLGQDGYHKRNDELSKEAYTSPQGKDATLRQYKGVPESFDLDRLAKDLCALREGLGKDSDVLPKYDRSVHEPVDGDAVAASQDVVVVEGLYLLSSAFAGLLDLSIYVDCSDQDSQERVVSRKVENGTPRADAEEQYGRVDSISMAAVKSTRGDADVRVDFGSEGGRFAISSVELGPSAKTGVEGRILAVGLFVTCFLSYTLPSFSPSPSLLPVSCFFPPPRVLPPSNFLVHIAGMNPAHQKTMIFDGPVEYGGVNRARSASFSVGGKGQHVAIAASRMAQGSGCVAHFLGEEGIAGEYISRELGQRGVGQLAEWISGSTTRQATTVLDRKRGDMTELIDPSDTVPTESVTALCEKIMDHIQARSSEAGGFGVALCGTFPPGVDEYVYAEIASRLEAGPFLLLDGFRGVDATLKTRRVDVLKINSDELTALSGIPDLDEAAAKVFELFLRPSSCLAVTRGPEQALLYIGQEGGKPPRKWVFDVPRLETEVANPIGAGAASPLTNPPTAPPTSPCLLGRNISETRHALLSFVPNIQHRVCARLVTHTPKSSITYLINRHASDLEPGSRIRFAQATLALPTCYTPSLWARLRTSRLRGVWQQRVRAA